MGLVFKRKAKVRNRRQKFLKVGQKFTSRRDKQGKGDSRRTPIKAPIVQKKESRRGILM